MALLKATFFYLVAWSIAYTAAWLSAHVGERLFNSSNHCVSVDYRLTISSDSSTSDTIAALAATVGANPEKVVEKVTAAKGVVFDLIQQVYPHPYQQIEALRNQLQLPPLPVWAPDAAVAILVLLTLLVSRRKLALATVLQAHGMLLVARTVIMLATIDRASPSCAQKLCAADANTSSILTNNGYLFNTGCFDMLFSGHAGTSLLAAFFITSSPQFFWLFRPIIWAFAIASAALQLMIGDHYTVDVVVAALVAWLVWHVHRPSYLYSFGILKGVYINSSSSIPAGTQSAPPPITITEPVTPGGGLGDTPMATAAEIEYAYGENERLRKKLEAMVGDHEKAVSELRGQVKVAKEAYTNMETWVNNNQGNIQKAAQMAAGGGGVPPAPDMGDGTGGVPPAPDMDGSGVPPAPDMGDGAGIPPPPPFDAPPFEAPPFAVLPPDAPSMDGGIPMPPDFGAPPLLSGPAKPKLKAKPKIKPRVAMKKLHWPTVSDDSVPTSMWSKVDESDVKIPEDEFESLFCARAPPVKKTPAATNGDGEVKEEKKPEVKMVSLIAQNRLVGFSGFLKRAYAMEASVILRDMDEKKLTADFVGGLARLAITQEDLDMCREYPNVNELDPVCRWLRDLASIRRLGSRIEILQFKFNFAEEIEKEQLRVKQVADALHDIQNSQRLTDVLKVILAFGNYLNGGTPKGGAHGFKLAALNNLQGTRSLDGSENLLSYVVKYLDDRKLPAKDVADDLKSCGEAVKVEQQSVGSDIRKLGTALEKVNVELKKIAAEPKNPLDHFAEEIEKFRPVAASQHETLVAQLKECESLYRSLLTRFGESDLKWEEFFAIWASFGQSMVASRRDRDDKEKKAVAEAQRKANQQAMADKAREGAAKRPVQAKKPMRKPTLAAKDAAKLTEQIQAANREKKVAEANAAMAAE